MRTRIVFVTDADAPLTSWKPNDTAADSVPSTQAAIGELRARSTRTSPPPIRVIGAISPPKTAGRFMMSVSAVFMSTALISSGDRAGKASRRSAAEPVTIGAAPDVPPNGVVPVPVPTWAETDAPGAPISGLIRLLRLSGPRDDEPTMCPTSGTPLAGSNEARAPVVRRRFAVAWLTM